MTRFEDVSKTVLSEKIGDAGIPGAQIEFDPDEADAAGAFHEDAVSAEDAAEASVDLNDAGAAANDEAY